jgi:hypothetical protein
LRATTTLKDRGAAGGGRGGGVTLGGSGAPAATARDTEEGSVARKLASKLTWATVPSLRKRRAGRVMPKSAIVTSKFPRTSMSRLPLDSVRRTVMGMRTARVCPCKDKVPTASAWASVSSVSAATVTRSMPERMSVASG